MSRKISKLVEDIELYKAAEEELAKYSKMNLGNVKAILDEMNGSYKKYDIFKFDVENLKETVEALKEYGNEGNKLVEKAEALMEEGRTEKARKLIREYKSDDRYEYMRRA